jgi:hypothetical protein
MLRPVGLLRLAILLRRAGGPHRAWLAVVLVAMVFFTPALGHAADPAPEPVAGSSEPASVDAGSGSSDWGPIVGASLGVLFGALLAAWQIRGMKRDA